MKASYNQETKIIDTIWNGDCLPPKDLETIDLPEELLEKFQQTNLYTFKFENGQIVEYFNKKEHAREQIEILKNKLCETDYQVTKHLEGLISEEDFLKIKKQRQCWRDEIGILEKEL